MTGKTSLRKSALYSSPDIEVIELSVENGFATSSGDYTFGGGGTYDIDDIIDNGGY